MDSMLFAGCETLTVQHAIIAGGQAGGHPVARGGVGRGGEEAEGRERQDGAAARTARRGASVARDHQASAAHEQEHLLSAADNVRVVWNAPVNPGDTPVEMVWSTARAYAKMRYAKGRGAAALAKGKSLLPAGARVAIDDGDVAIGVFVDQRIGKGEAHRTRADDQVIRLNGVAHRMSLVGGTVPDALRRLQGSGRGHKRGPGVCGLGQASA